MSYDNPSPENRFKPGESGNPNGRPKGAISLVGILRAKLEECPKEMDKRTYAQLLVQRALDIALEEGDVGMIRDLFDRVDGKPQGSVDVTSAGEKITALSPELAGIIADAEAKLKSSL